MKDVCLKSRVTKSPHGRNQSDDNKSTNDLSDMPRMCHRYIFHTTIHGSIFKYFCIFITRVLTLYFLQSIRKEASQPACDPATSSAGITPAMPLMVLITASEVHFGLTAGKAEMGENR